jgi:ferrous iron transport protein B
MDRVMHKLGLHGKSFIPMIMGFGCNVPAIAATRTLESRQDRIITILINPLVSCSARLPVYILLAGTFFPRHAGNVIFSIYLLGIVLAFVIGRLFKKTIFPTDNPPSLWSFRPTGSRHYAGH